MIKKFHAQTTREALRQVRDALGASAIILSNRQVAGGVEIIAVADLDMATLAAQAEPPLWAARSAPAAGDEAAQRSESPRVDRPPSQGLGDHQPPSTPLMDFLIQRDTTASVGTTIRPSPARKVATHPSSPPEITAPGELPAALAGVHELTREVRLLRDMVEGQLAGFAWNDLTQRNPLRAEVMRRMLAAGFSAALARQLLHLLPEREAEVSQAMKWLRNVIAHNIRVARPEDDIIEKGGVYALVGPTGVGKTTTVAKLAARAVLRHGAGKVALVTTDTYRIGAQDQLRIYGRILGTPVFAVRDENDLELTLSDLRNRHLVLIDTVGMSQRDKRVAEQVAMLCGEGREVSRMLLLGAPSQGLTLEEVARAYAGPGLIGAVLTKIDEALTYGPVLDVAIRHELPLHFVTNGQRVPEDLHLANAIYLADRAFRGNPKADSPYAQDEGDYPILMAASQRGVSGEDLGTGAIGAAG
ncbi:MAG TPA: flagellar biosynthesis protein FlhF [Thiobacillaceae bacterium]|nr:flagellar biosynthesis protein FlhF [Thiobacillaceae bacterium]HNU64937.1 flagellar biosynthesis protein FlhF [Thiobacillaceae bacterium]